jgi:polysaccharide export outer membrane protein
MRPRAAGALIALLAFAPAWARAQAAASPAQAPPPPIAAAASRVAAAPSSLPHPPAAASTRPAAPEYRLGAGDVVRIFVFQNADLSLETRVTDAGSVSYPLLGSLPAAGRTVNDLERLITDGLRDGNFVKQPQVTVVLIQVRGNQANVLGQVNRPGRYPLEQAETRLTDMLAIAGGTSPAGADLVVVTGVRDGKPFRAEIDLPALFLPDGGAQDLVVMNGDVIWVDRQPLVYIYGEVQRPGPMRLERGMTLMQALATGGGLTARGTERGIRVHRRGSDGQVQVLEVRMAAELRNGDVVHVPESLF